MKKKAKKNKSLQGGSIINEFQKCIAGIFVILMLGLFPLYYQNDYFDIIDAKKKFFVICTCGLAGLSILFIFLEKVWDLRQNMILKKDFAVILKEWKNYFLGLSLSSWFTVFFLLAMFLSTIFSVDPMESFLGTDGRKLGTSLFLLCICMYVILGKYLKPGVWMAWILLISNSILFGILILQFFGKDILHMWDKLLPKDYGLYLTTIGNTNACTSYFCMIIPVVMVLYYCSETMFSKTIYGLFLILGFYASYATNADSWILGIGVAFLVMLWFSLYNHKSIKSFLELCGIFWVSNILMKFTIFLNQNNADAFRIQMFQGLRLQSMMLHKYTLLVEIILLIICMHLVKNAEKKNIEISYQKIRRFLFVFLASLVGIIIVLCLIVNFSGDKLWESSLQWLNRLKIQDEFGSGRGIIWKHTMWVWLRLPLLQKFLGYGVNCFHQLYYSQGAEEILKEATRTIDPHNEFLYFLSITGILGLIAYVGLLASTAITAGKMSHRYPVMMMGTVMICSYLACSMVNCPTTLIIPTFFLYLGILKSMERHYKEKDLEIENKV